MGHARTILERLSRGRSFWRRLPPPFSTEKILVTPDASLSHLKLGSNWCDPELLHIVSTHVKPADTVWDIGANLGIFGLASAIKSGPTGFVLCVEPDLTLAALIRKSARRLSNNCAPLHTLAAAVADAPGIAEFCIAKRGRASNALAKFEGRSQMGGIRERQLVPVTSLDDLLNISPPPAVVKIDVEGAEAAIFDGAGRLLNESRPVIYVEVGKTNIEKVTTQLLAAAYDLFDPTQPLQAQTPMKVCRWNTLAIPHARPPQIA